MQYRRCQHCDHLFHECQADSNSFGWELCPNCGSDWLAQRNCEYDPKCESKPTCDDYCPAHMVAVHLSEGSTPDLSDWGLDASDYLPKEIAA